MRLSILSTLLIGALAEPLVVTSNDSACATEVSLDCTYYDMNGILQSCVNKRFFNQATKKYDYTPFISVMKDACNDIEIEALITMKFCNQNSDKTIVMDPPNDQDKVTTGFTIGGDTFKDGDIVADLGPGECKEFKGIQKLNTCRKNHNFSVGLKGTVKDIGGNCYGFAHNNAKIDIVPTIGVVPVGAETEECSESNQDGQVICNSKVSIKCTYEEGGVEKSCMNGKEAFKVVPAAQCQDMTLDAKVEMTVCNMNNGNIITPTPESTKYLFKGSPQSPVNKDNDYQPRECRTSTFQKKIDTCKKNWPMSVQLEGNMPKSVEGNSYCYCHLFNKSIVHKQEHEVLTTESSPYILPNPTPTPPGNPGPVKCDVTDVLITEVADPKGDENLRYIELKFTSCAGKTILDDVHVVLWPFAVPRFSQSLSLIGFLVPADGFVVLCRSEKVDVKLGNGQICDKITGVGSPADNDGTGAVAVVNGPPQNDLKDMVVLDIYGIVGSNSAECTFTDGRAVRVIGSTPSGFYILTQWVIQFGDLMSPRVWPEDLVGNDPLILFITELADPSDTIENRFIELYSPNKKDYTIVEDIVLVRDSTGNSEFVWDLKGKNINAGGFLVVCRSNAVWTNKCDYKLGAGSVADVSGVDDVSLRYTSGAVIDIFLGDEETFDRGRAVRIVSGPRANFLSTDWYVTPGKDGSGTADASSCDPNNWAPELEDPPSGNPPSGNPPSGNPPSVNPPSGNPPSGNPPSGNPPSGNPPSGNPPSGNPPSKGGKGSSGNPAPSNGGKGPSGNPAPSNGGKGPSGNPPSGSPGKVSGGKRRARKTV